MKNKNRKFLICITRFIIIAILFNNSYAQFTEVDSTDDSGRIIHLKINIKNGMPYRIYGFKANLNSYGQINNSTIPQITRHFLNDYSELFKIKLKDLLFDRSLHNNNKWYIQFRQIHNNLPIHLAQVGLTVHENGNIIMFGSRAQPKISIDTVPTQTPCI